MTIRQIIAINIHTKLNNINNNIHNYAMAKDTLCDVIRYLYEIVGMNHIGLFEVIMFLLKYKFQNKRHHFKIRKNCKYNMNYIKDIVKIYKNNQGDDFLYVYTKFELKQIITKLRSYINYNIYLFKINVEDDINQYHQQKLFKQSRIYVLENIQQ